MSEAEDHLKLADGSKGVDGPIRGPVTPAFQQSLDRLIARTWLRLFPRSARPNQVTVARFILIPVILVLLYFDYRWWAFGVFVLAVCTDFIDGAMARTRDQITQLGTYIDPIADKLLIGTVLAWVGWEYLVIKIIVVFILLELVLTAVGVSVYIRTGKPRGANYIGKTKMVVQSVALLMFLVASFLELKTLEIISVYLLWLALALAVLSGGKQVLTAIKSRPPEGQEPARIDLDNQRD